MKETDIQSNHHTLIHGFGVACDNDQLEIVEYLLKKKVHKKDPSLLNSKIYGLCEKGNLRIIECFVKYGVEISDEHNFCIDIAIQKNHWDIVDFLIKNGAASWIANVPRDKLLDFLKQHAISNSNSLTD